MTYSAARATALLSVALVLNQIGLMAFPAVLPTLMAEWRLSEGEAGWIGGIYFAGYAAAVPLLSGLTDRIDGRRIYAVAALIGAAASFAFALVAEGFWTALIARLLSGVGLAGVHMPGLKLLADRTEGAVQARASAIYTAVYALGSGGSFVVAGIIAAWLGWEWAFLAGGIGPLLSLPLLLPLEPPRAAAAPATDAPRLLDPRPVLRNRDVLTYILCYAGNTWEVFAVRTWFVAFVVFNQSLPHNAGWTWNAAVLSGLSAMISVPATVLIAELAVRFGRPRVIAATATASILVCALLGLAAEASFPLALALLILHGITSFGDTGSITGGAVAATDPRYRGLSLAAYAFAGFTTGFLGPLAVGFALQAAGGVADGRAWALAFAVMALGSAVSALTMLARLRRSAKRGGG